MYEILNTITIKYDNTWADKWGYILESHSLMKGKWFSTWIFKAPDEDLISRNMQCTIDVDFTILAQVAWERVNKKWK
jgi:hypothetical protein